MLQWTGERHEVGPDELFFSTTDDKGVIELSNDVFVRLSHFGRPQLHAAPHNIIRHPEMPGAAFRAMWDTLEAGQPFAAYVRNLAANGSEYDVFATVTPKRGGGYLSVRTPPCRTDLLDTATSIYGVVQEFEEGERARGLNRRESALTGLGKLVDVLHGAGLADYTEFQNMALPAEMEAREAVWSGFPERNDAWGPLRDALDQSHDLFDELDEWMREQSHLAGISQELKAVGGVVNDEITAVGEVGKLITERSAQHPELASALEALAVWQQMQGIIKTYLDKLLAAIDPLVTNTASHRFRISLARLHATMLGLFLAELIDASHSDFDESDYESLRAERLESLEMLLESLEDGLVDMAEFGRQYSKLLADTSQYLAQVVSAVSIPRQLLLLWLGSGTVYPPEIQDLVTAVKTSIDRTGEALAKLESLKTKLQNGATTHDFAPFQQGIDELRANVVAIRAETA